MMLALEATSMVGRKAATTAIITPVSKRATHGVFLFLEILAQTPGSIRSLPSAYDARVAEKIVALRAEVDAKITASVRRRLAAGMRRETASPKPFSLKPPIQCQGSPTTPGEPAFTETMVAKDTAM